MCDQSFCSYSDSIKSLSCLQSEKFNENPIKEIKDNVRDFPIRCPICWKIPRFYADFVKNYYFTSCDNQHKNEFYSFDSFIENTNKDINCLLCNNCHKEIEDFSRFYKCNICNIFICFECRKKHEKEKKHLNFIESNKIDNFCSNHNEEYKYYDSIKKSNLCQKCITENINNKKILKLSNHINYEKTINNYIKKVEENIIMWNNASSLINEWLKEFVEKIKIFTKSINNYILLQHKIVIYLNNDNNYKKYEKNFNVFFNYKIINNDKIDK